MFRTKTQVPHNQAVLRQSIRELVNHAKDANDTESTVDALRQEIQDIDTQWAEFCVNNEISTDNVQSFRDQRHRMLDDLRFLAAKIIISDNAINTAVRMLKSAGWEIHIDDKTNVPYATYINSSGHKSDWKIESMVSPELWVSFCQEFGYPTE